MLNVPHNLSYELAAYHLITFQLLEKRGIQHFSQLSHPLKPHLILFEEGLHGWELFLVQAEPSFDFIDGLHALIRLENEMIVSHAECHLFDALMQI